MHGHNPVFAADVISKLREIPQRKGQILVVYFMRVPKKANALSAGSSSGLMTTRMPSRRTLVPILHHKDVADLRLCAAHQDTMQQDAVTRMTTLTHGLVLTAGNLVIGQTHAGADCDMRLINSATV